MLQSFPPASPTCCHETSLWIGVNEQINPEHASGGSVTLHSSCDLLHVALCMGNFSHYISNTQLHLQGRFKFRLCQDINTLMRWQPCKLLSGINQGSDRLQRYVGRFMPPHKKRKREEGREGRKQEGKEEESKKKEGEKDLSMIMLVVVRSTVFLKVISNAFNPTLAPSSLLLWFFCWLKFLLAHSGFSTPVEHALPGDKTHFSSRFSLPLLVSSQYPLARGVWSRVESTTQAPNFCQGSKGINLSSRVRVLGGHYPAFNTSQEKGLQWWYSGYEVIEGPSHPWTYSSTLSVWLSSMLIAEKKAIIQNGPGNSLKSKHVPDPERVMRSRTQGQRSK